MRNVYAETEQVSQCIIQREMIILNRMEKKVSERRNNLDYINQNIFLSYKPDFNASSKI